MDNIIGTDEAGYGPNYGPLVIAATHWQVADRRVDLRESLAEVVCAQPGDETRLAICDSKQLFAARKSIAELELGVLAAFSLLDEACESFSAMLKNRLSKQGSRSSSDSHDELEPYFVIGDDRCPVASERAKVSDFAERLAKAMGEAGVRLVDIRVRCVFPDRFNQLLESRGNKATLLSHETLALIESMLPDQGNVQILCDKHGGRAKYAGLIQHCLTQEPVRVLDESLESSQYRWQQGRREFEANFVAKGESQLPIALASMAAKYVRERFMLAWNQFWIGLVPELKPTAGYPTDARRFRAAIADKQHELGIAEELVWRVR